MSLSFKKKRKQKSYLKHTLNAAEFDITDADTDTDSVRLRDLERLQDALLSAEEIGKLISSSESGCSPPTSTSLQ